MMMSAAGFSMYSRKRKRVNARSDWQMGTLVFCRKLHTTLQVDVVGQHNLFRAT